MNPYSSVNPFYLRYVFRDFHPCWGQKRSPVLTRFANRSDVSDTETWRATDLARKMLELSCDLSPPFSSPPQSCNHPSSEETSFLRRCSLSSVMPDVKVKVVFKPSQELPFPRLPPFLTISPGDSMDALCTSLNTIIDGAEEDGTTLEVLSIGTLHSCCIVLVTDISPEQIANEGAAGPRISPSGSPSRLSLAVPDVTAPIIPGPPSTFSIRGRLPTRGNKFGSGGRAHQAPRLITTGPPNPQVEQTTPASSSVNAIPVGQGTGELSLAAVSPVVTRKYLSFVGRT